MELRPFGPGRVPVPVIGQGTWMIERDRAAAVRALRRGLDLGLTHIDTAEMYGGGAAEEIVREAIQGRRGETFLVSKVLPSNAGCAATLAACDRSLRRLGTDHLDLYLLHWRDPGTPLAETFRAFDALLAAGKIRAFGVSNFDVADLDAAWALDRRLVCNQILYHPAERAVEHAVLPWCEAHGVAVVAYSPFAQGAFVGPASAGGRALDAVARAHGATPRQAALRFLVRRPGVFAIPKSADCAHVAENAGAGDLALTPADLDRIDRAFPLGPPRPLPTL